MKLTATEAILDGFVPKNILAFDLGIESRDIEANSFKNIKLRKVVLLQVPLSAIRFISSSEYTASLLDKDEDESKYEYILPISKYRKVGFWK